MRRGGRRHVHLGCGRRGESVGTERSAAGSVRGPSGASRRGEPAASTAARTTQPRALGAPSGVSRIRTSSAAASAAASSAATGGARGDGAGPRSAAALRASRAAFFSACALSSVARARSSRSATTTSSS